MLIASPALASANNGNWQTASRWARLLRARVQAQVIGDWRGEPCDALIALHARRSASSVKAYTDAHPGRPCIVVLTGTDLYRDIGTDTAAQESLRLASHLVVLQEQGLCAVPREWRSKCRVIFQSASPRKPAPIPQRVLRAAWVGHLRDEKDPLTLLRAAERLSHRDDIHIDLIGDALQTHLADAARAAQTGLANFCWLGPQPHAETRRRIQHAQLLINSSAMEGGAHVVLEAVQSGTAVLASRIDGNVGMLGSEYAGYFELGDDHQLARLIERARDDAMFLAQLRQQGQARSALFSPEREQQHLQALIAEALAPPINPH